MFTISVDGRDLLVPREVEAKGPAAIEAWVSEQLQTAPAKKRPPQKSSTSDAET